jgi:thiol:disulfide interchange protein DsbD
MTARSAALWALCSILGTAPAFAQDPIRWSIRRVPDAKPVKPADSGKQLTVVVTAQIDPGWHLYALTQVPGGPQATAISVAPPVFAINGAIEASDTRREIDPNFNIETEFHENRATFGVPVRSAENTKPGRHPLRVTVSYQTCDDRICLPPTERELTLQVAVGPEQTPPALSAGSVGAPSPAASSPAAPTTPAPGAARAPVRDLAAASRAGTFGAYLWLAAAMGALSLLTPCVFPMVPITVSYFTGRLGSSGAASSEMPTLSGRPASEALSQALVYGLGIILTFTAVGFTLAVAFGAAGLNRFAADPWLNLAVTALFILFALSLFGVYELALPSKLLTLVAKAEQGHGRFAGTLLMGLAFTLTSFTCTAPFLGTLLVVAAQGDWQWPLAGMLAFSTVFALPFVFLAVAPRFLAALPRSGVWLIAVKATMGMLELAAAMKFLSNADLVWGWGIFTREVVIGAWILIAIVLVVYLAGLTKLGRAPRLGRPRWARAGITVATAACAIWLATGLLGRRLGELEAFLPPADLAAMAPGGELPWILNDYDAALAEAARVQRPVLIDFTGYTCTNCRWMEANMFPRPEVARELARYVRVRLYTDGRGEPYRTFQRMEQTMFGTVALPYYAVVTPGGTPAVAFGGLTRDPAAFIAFLRTGMQ